MEIIIFKIKIHTLIKQLCRQFQIMQLNEMKKLLIASLSLSHSPC